MELKCPFQALLCSCLEDGCSCKRYFYNGLLVYVLKQDTQQDIHSFLDTAKIDTAGHLKDLASHSLFSMNTPSCQQCLAKAIIDCIKRIKGAHNMLVYQV